jgi:hypothetical protein
VAEKQATYKIRVDGDDDLVRAGDRIDQRWSSLGKKLKDGVGGAVKSVAQGMLGLVNDSIRVATAVDTINLGQLVSDTKRLELSYTKFAVGTRQSIGQVKTDAEDLAKALLMDPGDVTQLTLAYNKLTNQTKNTGAALEATNAVALSQGQEIGDVLPLTALLQKSGVAADDVRSELGLVADAADKLGYSGGAKALQDTLISTAGALQHVSLESVEARTKVTAFLGALTKGLGQDSQKSVATSVTSQVFGRAEQISRTVGYDILDPKTGKVKDLGKVINDLRSRALRLYGAQGALKVLRREFGNEEGTAIFNHDQAAEDKAQQANAGTDAGQAGPKAQDEINSSKAGQREQTRLDAERKKRDLLGEQLASVQDAFANTFKDHPVAGQATSLAIGGAGLSATGYLTKKLVGEGAKRLAGEGAKRLAVPAIQGAAGAAEGGSTLAGVGTAALPVAAGVAGAGLTLAAFGALKDLNKEDVLRRQKEAEAKEIAGTVSREAAAGKFNSIYDASPRIAALATHANVGQKSSEVREIVVEVAKILATDKSLPPDFATSLKTAFKDALRESGATVTTGDNPSRAKTAKAEAGGEGRT